VVGSEQGQKQIVPRQLLLTRGHIDLAVF